MAVGGNTGVSITFRANGAELASYMDRMQQRASELNRQALQSAAQQTASAREQLRILEQQIAAQAKKTAAETAAARVAAAALRDQRQEDIATKAAAREAKINADYGAGKITEKQRDEKLDKLGKSIDTQTAANERHHKEDLRYIREEERRSLASLKLQRDSLDTVRNTAADTLRQLRNGDRDVVDALHESQDPLEQLAAQVAEDEFDEESKKGKKGAKELIGSILAVDNINRLLGTITQIASTNNGFDLIKPTFAATGQIIGGILGAVIGGFATGGAGVAAGAMVGMGIGGTIGNTIGSGIGEFEQRRGMAIQNFAFNQNRYKAITMGHGTNDIPDMRHIGMSADQYMESLRTSALRRGNADEAERTAVQAAYLNKGLGVEGSTMNALIELQRSNALNSRDLQNLVRGVLAKGTLAGYFNSKDNVFLDEFLQKFATVQKDFLKNQNVVGSATTVDIMTQIGRLGGPFDLRDQRSIGNLQAIQSGLTNPGSDSLKALSFLTLRRLSPSAGLFDILRSQQQGLSGDKGMAYLRGILGFTDTLGGDDDLKKLMVSGIFPGLSYDAVDQLYKNRGALNGNPDKGFLEDISQGAGPSNPEVLAQNQTTLLERNMADIQNGLLGAWNITLDRMVSSFSSAISVTLAGARIEMTNGRLVIPGGVGGTIPSNVTKNPNVYKSTPARPEGNSGSAAVWVR